MSDAHIPDDLVARLDAMDAADTPSFANDLMREASAEIDSLREQLKRMTEVKDAVNETLGKVVAERNSLRTELREIADVMERDGRFVATVKAIRQTVNGGRP